MSKTDERLAALDSAMPAKALVLTPLSNVEPEKVEWLWPGRLAKGKINFLVGDPGIGKSFLSIAIAAAVTKGIALPEGQGIAPQGVVMWNGEDGLADTIRPRAEAAGADLDRFTAIEGVADERGRRCPFGLADIDMLAAHLRDSSDVGLVIIDPIAALLAGVDTSRDADVRSTLQPLAELATSNGVAVLLVAHLNKKDAEKALYRVGGSIGFVGLARSVILAAADPEDGRRFVASLKCNLAAPPRSVEYRIDAEGHLWWCGASDATAAHLLRRPKRDHGGAVHEAERTLS